MLDILYEDKDILVVVKPAGVESQTSRRLEPDMVSEIKNYLHRKVQETKKLSTGLSPKASTAPVDPYVGIIHRLDKPVRGPFIVPSPGDGKKNGVFHQTAICSVSELFYKSRK